MADSRRIPSTEIHLLKKELEVQGELLNQERLERKSEVDLLRLELESLKELIERLHPGSFKLFQEIYDKEKRTWNPELERRES